MDHGHEPPGTVAVAQAAEPAAGPDSHRPSRPRATRTATVEAVVAANRHCSRLVVPKVFPAQLLSLIHI
eukprot:5625738-Prorocentrum_lima.AAC.1